MLRSTRFGITGFVLGLTLGASQLSGQALASPTGAALPSPEDFLGHPVGADRKLAPYPRVLEYLRLVDQASDRVSIEPAGTSTEGNEMPVVVLTSPGNQGGLARYREISRRLAEPDRLAAGEAQRLVAEGKVIALVTCTIHSTEVGCTQMAMELAWEFATTGDPDRLAWMEEVILLLMPSINPDGQHLVIDWYEEHLGTPHEGGPMPWLYHRYVGHDNNRDFYMLTQAETRVVNEVLYHRWFPQVFLDEHQMGSTGPRMFVPPQTNPLAPEVHSLIFRQADTLGTHMALRLEEAGKLGVGSDMIYDSYWPGGTRNTAWWKNVTGLLTEVASADIATPVYIEPGELRGGYKGLPLYQRRSNFPSPWWGGWWRLRDIVEYELVATWAFLESCAENRDSILGNFHAMAAEAVAAGRNGPPYAWVVSAEQHDPVAAGLLVELLLRHGVRVYRTEGELAAGRATYPAGTTVIPAAQPYRQFLLTMLRPQRYPEVLPYAGGPVIPPYDVTSWSLPISMGVEVVELDRPLTAALAPLAAPAGAGVAEALARPIAPLPPLADGDSAGYLLPHAADSVFTAMNRLLAAGKRLLWLAAPAAGAPGDVFVPAGEIRREEIERLAAELRLPLRAVPAAPAGRAFAVRPVRVGLYKPWRPSMDEGWTRWLLERYEFPFVNLSNEEIRKGGFEDEIDVLLFPDVEPDILAAGEPKDEAERRTWTPLPPTYAGGLDVPAAGKRDEAGGKRIKRWVEAGGTVVALDSAAGYLIDLLKLPVEDVLAGVSTERFHCPGSMLRLLVDTDHPLAYGMREEEAGYFADSPAFQTHVPDARFARRVIASYPDDERDILVSGYLEGGELLERRAAAVELRVGKGRVVLIGFRAQHRAQPHRTFKLLFNALYLPGLEEIAL